MMTLSRLTKRKNAKHLIVFVHGFTGDVNTFVNDKDQHLFKLLKQDIINQCNFSEFIYYSKLLDRKWLLKIPLFRKYAERKVNHDIKTISQLLKTHYVNFEKEYATINFICHSMGGIIAKQLIVDLIAERGAFNGFYITLATPHRGVEEAALAPLFKNSFVNTLRPFSEQLEELSLKWNNISHKVKSKYYCGLDDVLVSEVSCCPSGEAGKLLKVEGTHTSIAKPRHQDAALIRNLNIAIEDYLHLLSSTAVPSSEVLEDQVLFIAYKREYREYYYVRTLDDKIANVLSQTCLWLSGKPGCGKTALIQYNLIETSKIFYYIDLSPSAHAATMENLYKDIFEEIKTIFYVKGVLRSCSENAKQGIIKKISDLLCNVDRTNLHYVVIDEVPLNNESQFNEFVDMMIALINYHSNRPDITNSIRFVILTNYSPEIYDNPFYKSKLTSFFALEDLDYWANGDLYGLLEVISHSLKLHLLSDQKDKIVAESCGSPRKLKNIIKRYLLFKNNPDWSIFKSIEDINREGIY